MMRIRSVKKKALTVLVILLALGIVLQFFRPALDNPPVRADLVAPPEVKAILQRACYDCHSNQTRLAWFDQPVPAYWLVVKDIKKGREVLNFSIFDSLPKAQQAGKLYEALNQIEFHSMPLKQYAFLHHGATISPEEITVLRQYLLTLAPKAVPDTVKQRLTLEQFARWTAGFPGPAAGDASSLPWDHAPAPKDALNGISWHDLADFANWKAISTTERFDNGTMRLILANAIAEQAIREGHTNPWPRGATFAKAAWDQLVDSAGEIHTGAFKQVEFMIRDDDKYGATDGWGFARWVGGLELKPYGKNGDFVTECTNCHQTMAFNDHVFTFPLADTLALIGVADSLADSFAGHPMTGKVITSFADPRLGTMSTLYGSDVAVKSARSGQAYPTGAVVTLVTWSQRQDPHWFGGRIPDSLKSVERVSYHAGGTPGYKIWSGGRSTADEPDSGVIAARIEYITTRKASVMP
jgi:hypothetical protein